MKNLILTLSISMLLSSCATIVSDSKYPVMITSNPVGAKVEITDDSGMPRFSGMTPINTTLASGNGYFTRARYNVKFEKEGYATQVVPVKASIDNWYWANFILGGVIGLLVVDPLTGAMFEIDEKNIASNLPLENQTKVAERNEVPASLDLSSKLRELKKLKEDGVLTEKEYNKEKSKILDR